MTPPGNSGLSSWGCPVFFLNIMAKFNFFLACGNITKAEQRIVEGIASTETADNQSGVWNGEKYDGDIVETGAIEEALADYLKWGNIREMHQPSAVGNVLKAQVVDGQFFISAKIEDESAWNKVKSRVYKGFSIGGKILKAVVEQLPDGRKVRRILKFLLSEISLVDRPANPEAEILVWKAEAFMDEEEKTPPEEKPVVTPASIVAGIQALRNQAELEGDMEAASMYTQAIAMITQAKGDEMGAEAEGEMEAEKVQKAGRAIATPRMQAMHKILKSLLEIMSEAGDELAQKMMGVYGPAPKEEQKGEGFDAGKLAEAIQKAMAGELSKLSSAVEALAKSPMPGGPVMRPVDKQINGSGGGEAPKPPSEAEVLQKMYNDTVDPLVKARIGEQIAGLKLRNMFSN
jgi:flagellin-specific chaperone FliS